MTATLESNETKNKDDVDVRPLVRNESLDEEEEEEEEEKRSVERILRSTSSSDDDETKRKWSDYDKETELWVRQLPKVELHVHLDGSFDPKLLKDHLKRTSDFSCLPEQTVFPWDPNSCLEVRRLVQESISDGTEFQRLVTCRGKKSLQAMIACFEIFVPIVRGKLDFLEELAFDFCKRQWRQNIVYTEVRYNPHLLATGGSFNSNTPTTSSIDANPVVDAITRGLRRGEQQYNIIVNQILCCIQWRPDWAMDVVRMAKERKEDFPCAVVGVDIAAGEEHFDSLKFPDLHGPHWKAMQCAKEWGLNITLHAGEVGSFDNVWKATQKYGATRIGHGYRIVDSPEIPNVHFEVCPTSSIETGSSVRHWKEHEIVTMLKRNCKFSIHSDDPSVFQTNLLWQYRIALGKMKFTRTQLKQTILDAAEASFAPLKTKTKLLQIIQNYTL